MQGAVTESPAGPFPSSPWDLRRAVRPSVRVFQDRAFVFSRRLPEALVLCGRDSPERVGLRFGGSRCSGGGPCLVPCL